MMQSTVKISRTLIPLIIFLLIAVFLWKGLNRDPHNLPSTLIGKALPEFRAPSLQNPINAITNNNFMGKITLLNVFATWCISCRYENPTLLDIKNSTHLNIVGLNYKDDRNAALKWLDQYGNPYTTIIEDPSGQLGINFGVYGTPETFVIDRHGVVRYKFVGPMSPDDWKDTLLPIINNIQ